jgi:hypothetical protein
MSENKKKEIESDSKEKTKKRSFDIDDFVKFIDEFKCESDRASVILGVAKLDLLLYQIIQQFLLPCTGSKDELMDGDSPLGTFSAKIMLANRLGLIDNEFTRSLQLVRKIRNSFAHEVSGCSLDSGSHRDRVKELVTPLKHKNAFLSIRKISFDDRDTPSTNFRTALAILVGRLDVLLTHIEPIDSSLAFPIFGAGALNMGEIESERKDLKAKEKNHRMG